MKTISNTSPNTSSKVAPWSVTIVAALLPLAVVSFLLHSYFDKTLFGFVPSFPNDEVMYWLQSSAFSAKGFGTGYFVVNEIPAPASFTHFAVHGPMYPATMAVFGKLLGGWHPWTGAVLNALFITVGLILFVRLTRLSRRDTWITGITVASFGPVILLMPSNMQEGLHQAVGIILATLFVLLFRYGPKRKFIAGFYLFLGVACLLRASWILLLLPLLFLTLPDRRWRPYAAVGITGVSFIFISFVWKLICAPQPGGGTIFVRVLTFQASPVMWWNYIKFNLGRLFEGEPLEFAGRFMMVGVCAVLLAYLAGRRRTFTNERPLILALYNLLSVVTTTILVYIVGEWGDYRVWSAHLLVSILLMLAMEPRVGRIVCLVTMLCGLPWVPKFLETFKGRREANFAADPSSTGRFANVSRTHLRFDEEVGPWCNTVDVVDYPYVYPEMAGLTPGIGISPIYEGRLTSLKLPLQAKWVLVKPEVREAAHRLRSLGNGIYEVGIEDGRWIKNLKLLALTPIGGLYRNLDAPCGQGPMHVPPVENIP